MIADEFILPSAFHGSMLDYQLDCELLNEIILGTAVAPWDAHYLVAKYGFRRETFPVWFFGNLEKARVAVFGYNPLADDLVDAFETALINHQFASNPDNAMAEDPNAAFMAVIGAYYSMYFDDKQMEEQLRGHLSPEHYEEIRARMIGNSLYKSITRVYQSPFVVMNLLPYRSPKTYLKIFDSEKIYPLLIKNWMVSVKNLFKAEHLALLHFSGRDVFKKALKNKDARIFPPSLVEITSVAEGAGNVLHGECTLKHPESSATKQVKFVVTSQVTSKVDVKAFEAIHQLVKDDGIKMTLF
ncbi:MAG: hypothetical protein GYA24_23070 [Candidatus Lokiarchaeota archaeon]|nr:hypothetical protein [Candidatus Lokiarchaeota archaeon]